MPDTEANGIKLDAYLFYDPLQAQAERDSIHGAIRLLKKLSGQREEFSRAFVVSFEPWLKIRETEYKTENGRNFKIEQHSPKIQEILNQAGMFVVLSNEVLPPARTLKIARIRDREEENFHNLKQQLELSENYQFGIDTYEGKMFVAFVAMIVMKTFNCMRMIYLGPYFYRRRISGA